MRFHDLWTKELLDGRKVRFALQHSSEGDRHATVLAQVIEGDPKRREVLTVATAPAPITRQWVESQFEW